MRLLAYTRVSTLEQEQSGQSLDAQEHLLVQHATQRDWWIIKTAREQGSGKDLERPKLQELLEQLARGEADGLIVTRLDRLTRSVADFVQLVEWFKNANKALIVLDFDLDTSTPAGELIAHMMAALAQWQRRVIADNTRLALQGKRLKGERINQGGIIDHPELAEMIKAQRSSGASYQQIADYLNGNHVPTLRGGSEWRRSSLQALLRDRPARQRARRAKLPEVR